MERPSTIVYPRFVREIPRELVDLGHTIQEKKPKVDNIVSPKSAYAQMKMNFQAKTSLQKKDFTVSKAASPGLRCR